MLETNVEEIDHAGMQFFGSLKSYYQICFLVQDAAKARKESYASSNPLSLGAGGVGSRGTVMQTPLGWLTGKLTGVGAR